MSKVKYFRPKSPDPSMKGKGANMGIAKFGHLNEIMDVFKQMQDNVYANNAAAITGGLVPGDFYRTATGEIRIVV